MHTHTVTHSHTHTHTPHSVCSHTYTLTHIHFHTHAVPFHANSEAAFPEPGACAPQGPKLPWGHPPVTHTQSVTSHCPKWEKSRLKQAPVMLETYRELSSGHFARALPPWSHSSYYPTFQMGKWRPRGHWIPPRAGCKLDFGPQPGGQLPPIPPGTTGGQRSCGHRSAS